MKNTLIYIVNYEKATSDQKKEIEICNMTSVNLEKTLEYLKTQESLRSENLKSIIYVNEQFYVFLYRERYYTTAK